MKSILNLCLVFLCFCPEMFGQDTIRLKNPSFEDKPACCTAPKGWWSCVHEYETSTDIQPGIFEVKKPAVHGNTYLGMVTRDNGTWEAVQQKLSIPLKKDSLYTFSVWLAKSDTLMSHSRLILSQTPNDVEVRGTRLSTAFIEKRPDAAIANYSYPARLRIWASNKKCGKGEMLNESPMIENTDWRRYNFQLNPKESDYQFITLEAYFESETSPALNGNLLVDGCSPIIQITR